MSEWLREGHVDCVSCPNCAFTFDACHEDRDGGYTCPVCREIELTKALEEIRSWRGMYHGPTRMQAIAKAALASNQDTKP